MAGNQEQNILDLSQDTDLFKHVQLLNATECVSPGDHGALYDKRPNQRAMDWR